MSTIDIIIAIIEVVFGLISIYAGIVGWLVRRALTDQDAKIDKTAGTIAEVQMEFDAWKEKTAIQNATTQVNISRLDTLVSERLNDIVEIKETMDDIRNRFVCKIDLRDAIHELKEFIKTYRTRN